MKILFLVFTLVLSLSEVASALSNAPTSAQCKSAVQDLQLISVTKGIDKQKLEQMRLGNLPLSTQRKALIQDDFSQAHALNAAFKVCH